MRPLTRLIDFFLRRSLGVFEFSNDESCLLRLQITKAPHRLDFPGTSVPSGEPVLEIHLWNEHIPRLPPAGPGLAWASQTLRLFVQSLSAAAREIQNRPRYDGIRAIGAVTAVLAYGDRASGERMMRQLGFTMMPYRNRMGRFGEFWENLYAWWLMDAYNPGSLRPRRFFQLRHSEMWMPVEDFLKRYGQSGIGTDPTRRAARGAPPIPSSK